MQFISLVKLLLLVVVVVLSIVKTVEYLFQDYLMNINIQISAFLEVKKLLEHNTLYHSSYY